MSVCLCVCLERKVHTSLEIYFPCLSLTTPSLPFLVCSLSSLSSAYWVQCKVAVSPHQWWRMKLSSHLLSLVYLVLALVCFFICLEQIKSYLSYPKGTTVQVFRSTRVSTHCHCLNFLSNSWLIEYIREKEFLKVNFFQILRKILKFTCAN